MLPCQLLEHVAKLIDDAPIAPEISIFLIVKGGDIRIVTKKGLEMGGQYIFHWSKKHRQNGLTSSEWSVLFGRLMREYLAGSLKGLPDTRKELPDVTITQNTDSPAS